MIVKRPEDCLNAIIEGEIFGKSSWTKKGGDFSVRLRVPCSIIIISSFGSNVRVLMLSVTVRAMVVWSALRGLVPCSNLYNKLGSFISWKSQYCGYYQEVTEEEVHQVCVTFWVFINPFDHLRVRPIKFRKSVLILFLRPLAYSWEDGLDWYPPLLTPFL